MRMRPVILPIFLAALGLGAAASTLARQTEGSAVLDVGTSPTWGQYLVDGEGRALYMFTADQKNQSNCYDACAEKWPPLLTEESASLEHDDLDDSHLGTIERRDGKMQVTYGGWPLYYYYEDRGAGQAKGQDVHDSGGEWYLVSPEGNKIEEKATE